MVVIFAIVKFTEGAWVVVVLFVVLVPALIRLNREYAAESEVLETLSEHQPPPPPHYGRRTVFVFVDSFDLAALAALRYARSLRPTTLRAVHFVIDNVQAEKLRQKWTRADRGVPLDFIDVPDRRLTRAAAELVERETADPDTHVTVVLPRRSYSALLGRLLHDRTADKIAAVVSRIPAVRGHHRALRRGEPGPGADRTPGGRDRRGPGSPPMSGSAPTRRRSPRSTGRGRRRTARAVGHGAGWRASGPRAGGDPGRDADQASAPGVAPIGSLTRPGRAAAEGRVVVVEIRPVERNSVLACEISDGTGQLTALFYGRSHIPGIVCGARVRFRGSVGIKGGRPVMINPAYELLFPAV